MPLHKVEEMCEQLFALQCLPRSEDDMFAPRAGERGIHPSPILDEVTDLGNWEI